MKTYTFFQDGGHGWLKVKKSELEALGIADKITRYSYEYKEWVYLEEDCDLSTFFNAKGWTGNAEFWKSGIIKNAYSERSKIRSYIPYRNVPYIKPAIGDLIELNGAVYRSARWIDKNRIQTQDGMTWKVLDKMIGSKIEDWI